MIRTSVFAAVVASAAFAGSAAAIEVDPALPAYKAASGVDGSLKSIGSDTLNNLMTLWAEGFKAAYPNVKIEIEGKGSSTAPPALISGTAQFGPMSRPMRGAEIDEFEKKYGYKPVALRTAVDALAVFVHKDNPIQCLSLAQVDAMFSKTRKRGRKDDVTTWGQVGLTGEWANLPISTYGRNSASGTYGYFKEVALSDGDYKDSVKEQPGSSAVVQAVASDKGAIGYSGVGYKTADVRAVPLSVNDGGECFEVTPETAYAGDYPITRFLYVYINKNPGRPMDPLRAEFVRYVLSRQGQEAVIKDGYYPITAEVAAGDFRDLGLN
ncbi:MAG: phosphate ABC transporter substrate-binding protein PstS family protein [Rhodospirillaceae bacterium]|nr:phosphate ABC transporter substrate-binding protein PstS family protein [Rhodospirillaceae bacterium]